MTRTTVLTVAAGAAGAALVWAAAVLAGIELGVTGGGGPTEIGIGDVLVAAVVAGLAGMALLAVLRRVTVKARAIWTAVALVALLVSLAGPLGAASVSAGVALAAMHVVVGAVIVAGGRRATREVEA